MELKGKVAIVTGAAGGLGRAVCARFAGEGALVCATDREDSVHEVAVAVGGLGVVADIATEDGVRAVVAATQRRFGRVDLYFSNAGGSMPGGRRDVYATNESWQFEWQLHVMSHVWAAQLVLPGMAARGEGYLVSTASGAGLTSEPASAPYSVTKHAAIALAEWLSIAYRDRGVRVSCFTPYGMLTPMLLGRRGQESEDTSKAVGMQGAVTPEEAAEAIVQGIRAESFLILSHPEALTYFQRKASDYDRWLGGMRRLYQDQLSAYPLGR